MNLEIKNLSFNYPGKNVLRDVNLSADTRGEVIAVIGPNATGKSTLFRCIAGLLKPAKGQISFSGNTAQELGPAMWSKHVCFTPQFFSSNAALTVFETVLLAKKHMNGWRVRNRDIEAVSDILSELNIGHLSQTYISDLSGGQQQMASLAQAFVRTPDIFLLDEPTSALDLKHQLQIMHTVRKVTHERNTTTFVALHDLNLAARYADRLILMREGMIIEDGAASQVLSSTHLADTYGVNIEMYETKGGVKAISASL
ncbi:ABC transporter ATP-binding protein [Lentilitoribacter sp. EG35]|uniref:ABC transporter ATP-binding protein n=1 Tax=Lentilitoribacter sp. EG35 TaxID=3234192 RepID=UPI00346040C2